MSLKNEIDKIVNGKKDIIDLCAGPGNWLHSKPGYKVAVEIDSQYFERLQLGYEEVHIEDVRNIPTMSMGKFDLCLWIDGIEHLEEADAIKLLDYMEGECKELLIFTPHNFIPNDYGEIYQKHLSVFPKEFWADRGYTIKYEENNTVAKVINVLYHKVVEQ